MFTVYKQVDPKDPVLIAAWPGMGQVAIRAAEHLKDALKAKLFAGMEPGDFFYHSDVAVERGMVSLPALPRGRFYHWSAPAGKRDLIIFINDMQPPPERCVAYAHRVLDFAVSMNIRSVFTFAAILTTVDYMTVPTVWGAATGKALLAELRRLKVKKMDSCHISGMNGLFLGVAKKRGLQGVSLLSEIPFYASQIENPRASLAILRVMERYLGIGKMDYADLTMAEKVFEEEIGKLLDFIRKPFDTEEDEDPITQEDIEQLRKNLHSERRIPNSAKKTIEELFEQAKREPILAIELKKKLDEWHVYPEYEDRFLQLFKKDKGQPQ